MSDLRPAHRPTTARFPDLDGASVFVTGGATGIGAALVAGFAAQGARVAFLDRQDGTALAAEVAATGAPRPLALTGDVTDTAALSEAIDAAEAAHGLLDVLVCNAANDRRIDPMQVTPADWDALMAVNLGHVFFACQRAARSMRGRGGRIVALSSIAYALGMGEIAAYTAAKAGVTALVRSLSRAWGPEGVRANALLPGMVLTDRQLAEVVSPEGAAAFLERQCLKETIGPADMVGPALFLASDASRMMTAQTLVVDAGVVGGP